MTNRQKRANRTARQTQQARISVRQLAQEAAARNGRTIPPGGGGIGSLLPAGRDRRSPALALRASLGVPDVPLVRLLISQSRTARETETAAVSEADGSTSDRPSPGEAS